MTTALTIRLDDDDFALLVRRASELGMRPGVLAKVLIHRGLRQADYGTGVSRDAGREALRSLACLTDNLPPVDALAVANDARTDLIDRRM